MNRMYLLGVALILAACGGASEAEEAQANISEAVCADLRNGMSVAQLKIGDPDTSAQDFAARLYLWTQESCPEVLAGNEGLRSYLNAWGIDPDS